MNPNHFIIATHSNLANGIKASVDFFLKDKENVDYINAYLDNQDFESEFLEVVEKNINKNIVVLTDIKGGSITQTVVKHLYEYDYKVISGINVALVLELLLHAKPITEENIKKTIKLAKEDMIYLNEYFNQEEEI